MLTRLRIENFKALESVDIELGQSVVFIGPNNAGKTSALQALTLWASGISEWNARRENSTAKTRTGVTINRRALVHIPVITSRELWLRRQVTNGATPIKLYLLCAEERPTPLGSQPWSFNTQIMKQFIADRLRVGKAVGHCHRMRLQHGLLFCHRCPVSLRRRPN